MSNSSTVILERNSPRLATITFSNPPGNVTVGETVDRLAGILGALGRERPEHVPRTDVERVDFDGPSERHSPMYPV